MIGLREVLGMRSLRFAALAIGMVFLVSVVPALAATGKGGSTDF